MAALLVARPLTGTDVPSASPWHFWHTELGVPPGLRQGLLVVLLWLVLAAVWCMGHLSSGRRWRPCLADGVVGLLLILHSASALWAVWHAAPRPALNSLWVWLGMGAAYFLVRLATSSPREVRGLIAVMISVALPLASYGLYQHFIELPETRASYEQDREKLLREAGLSAVVADPAAREAYENRVRSREPFGTFALANSLSGFLAPWCVVCMGLVARQIAPRETSATVPVQPSLAFLLPAVGVLAACLLATKSRSAWLGVAAGGALLGLGVVARRSGAGVARWLVAGVAALGLLVALGIWSGSLDAKVLTESFKSFRYRLEYWQGSLGIVREHPWAGCGPGNFRDAYTGHKLDTASEEVADPHNLFVEVWATAGTPAALALVGMYLALAASLWRGRTAKPPENAPPAPVRSSAKPVDEPEDGDPTVPLAMGAVGGLFVGWFVGLTVEMPLSAWVLVPGLVLSPLTMWALRPWILAASAATAPEDARLAACGALALSVHLLAAGGISFPGVAESLWLLVALALTSLAGWPAEKDREPIRRARTWITLAGTLVLVALCYFTAYLPVSRQAVALRHAGESRQPESLLLEADAADPYSDTAAMALAEFYFERWLGAGDEADLQRFETWKERGQARRPQAFTLFLDVANWYGRAYQKRSDPRMAQAAGEAATRAVELYPNSTHTRYQSALAEQSRGNREQALREAREALRLDEATPHLDKKLRPEQREAMQRITQGQ